MCNSGNTLLASFAVTKNEPVARPADSGVHVIQYVYAAWFLLELILRVYVDGRGFFCGEAGCKATNPSPCSVLGGLAMGNAGRVCCDEFHLGAGCGYCAWDRIWQRFAFCIGFRRRDQNDMRCASRKVYALHQDGPGGVTSVSGLKALRIIRITRVLAAMSSERMLPPGSSMKRSSTPVGFAVFDVCLLRDYKGLVHSLSCFRLGPCRARLVSPRVSHWFPRFSACLCCPACALCLGRLQLPVPSDR